MLATDIAFAGVAHVCAPDFCHWTLDLGSHGDPNAAPTVTGPVPFLYPGQTLGNPSAGVYTVNVQARWTASDPDNGIASQTLQLAVNGGGFSTVSPGPSASARAHNVPMTIGTTDQLRISATDPLGATGGPANSISFKVSGSQQTSTAFTYTGTWTNLNSSSSWGGTMKYTNGAAGAKAVYSFYGGRAALIGSQRPDGGKADIYVDGVYKGTVDFYSPTLKNRRVLFAINGMARKAPGGVAHTLEVRWINSHHASSSGFRLYIDGAIALN
jgi:bacillopeptidase F